MNPKVIEEKRYSTLNAEEATRRLREAGMRIRPDTLRLGLIADKFPFGTAYRTETSVVCWVYPQKLEAWIKEYLTGGAET